MANTRRSSLPDPSRADRRPLSNKRVGVRIPPQLNARLHALARHESNNISSVVRRLLTQALDVEEA